MRKREKELKDIHLNENQTFKEYMDEIDDALEPKYKEDIRGKRYLFPQKKLYYAHRPDIKPGEDWNPFRKSGIGWKLNPTIYLAFFFFGIPFLAYPLVYLFMGYPNFALTAFLNEFWIDITFIIIVVFFTSIIGYSIKTIDSYLRTYGKNKEKMQKLFTDELEYLKFSIRYYEKTYSVLWMVFGFIPFLITIVFSFLNFNNISFYEHLTLISLPEWTNLFNLFRGIGISLVLFQIVTFNGSLIYGQLHLGSLGKNPGTLSITQYHNVLVNIIKLAENALTTREKDENALEKVKFVGGTYFEFQRANRVVGELLFDIAKKYLFVLIPFEISIDILTLFQIIQSKTILNFFMVFRISTISLMILTVFMFILPQRYIHKRLRDFKSELIDTYSILASRLEYMYYATLIDAHFLDAFDEWDTRDQILRDIDRVEKNIEKVQAYGTWSYDLINKTKKATIIILSPVLSLMIPLFRFLFTLL